MLILTMWRFKRTHCKSLELFVWPFVLQYSVLWILATFGILNSVFSTHGDPWTLCGFPLSALCPAYMLYVVTWDSPRGHLVCFSFLRDHCPVLPIVWCLNNLFSHISFLFFRWENILGMEITVLFFFFFNWIFFLIIYFIYLFIYFWLCWVFGSCEGFL